MDKSTHILTGDIQSPFRHLDKDSEENQNQHSAELLTHIAFMEDVGLDVLSWSSPEPNVIDTRESTIAGCIVFEGHSYAKNMLELLEISFVEDKLRETDVLVYCFKNLKQLNEDVSRISQLFKA